MRPPSWWRDEYRSNALLYACAQQQFTAEETLSRHVQQYNDLFEKTAQLLMHERVVYIVKKEKE